MKRQEALKYLDKHIRIILSNQFKFQGVVVEITEDTLRLNDRLDGEISIGLDDIMLCSEVRE